MLQTAGASPFSGAATPPPAPTGNTKKKARNATRGVWGPQGQQRAPQHQGNFAGGVQGSHVVPWDPQGAMAEIQRLNALLLAQSQTNVAATMADFNAYRENTGFRTVPTAFFGAQERPFYCFVHGHNNSHPGSACKVMAQDQWY